jgi:tetratricopeptide (TPR) repeat protein
MKKNILIPLLFLLGAALFAENGGDENVIQSDHYEITVMSPGESSGQVLARELEARFAFYNRIFHFDTRLLELPLKVKIFSDQRAYNDYVASRLGSYRPGAVYLHYNRREARELVINRGSRDEEAILPSQAFLQFLRGFIHNPPAWIREGFTIYFNNLRFKGNSGGAGDSLVYEENLDWLEAVKRLGRNGPSPGDILRAGPEENGQTFQICSWALVSFFLNSGNSGYSRALYEIFMALSRDAGVEDNSAEVTRRFNLWTDMGALSADYYAYVNSRKTFMELMEDGRRAYGSKIPQSAAAAFRNALTLQPENHAPYYYLGLLAYESKDYDEADKHYQSALRYGADEALISYARGLNAATAGKTDEAVRFLEQAGAASPSLYKARTDELIRQLYQGMIGK